MGSRSHDFDDELKISFSKNANILSQIITNMNNFHPLQVVGRSSETQLEVGEN